tara:strand:- start:75 stop:203 length:129 start_codon:yes stop_codon:yes gene_type:complete
MEKGVLGTHRAESIKDEKTKFYEKLLKQNEMKNKSPKILKEP